MTVFRRTCLSPARRLSSVDTLRLQRSGDWNGSRRLADAWGRARHGFTLIELLFVLVVLGVVMAFAAPKIDVTAFKVNGAVQAVGTTIMAVQRQAMTEQHDMIVLFDSANSRIRIHDDANNSGAINAGEHVRSIGLGDGVVFGRGSAPAMPIGSAAIVIAKRIGGVPALVFHRDGSASENGGFYITSQRAQVGSTRSTDAREVNVERATGRANGFRYGLNGWEKLF